jgi:uncharacterized protein YycO
MKKMWFHVLHYITGKISKLVARIHYPWTRKLTSYSTVIEMLDRLQKGDVILTRTRGELTTWLIPGYWKHAAIFLSNTEIADATRAGVGMRHLADLVMKADYVAIMRLKDINIEEQCRIVEYSRTHFGKNYDFEMWADNSDDLFCSEYVMACVNHIRPGYLEFRKRFGLNTFTPQDIFDAKKKFSLIWNNN